MPLLSQLVRAPSLDARLAYVVRPRVDPAVEAVALVEDLAEMERVGERTVVLVTRGAAEGAAGYKLDTSLRLGRGRVAALVLPARAVARVTPTAAAIADRSGTAILGTGDDTDLADLAVAIGREVAGESDVALLRAHTAMRAMTAHPAGGTVEAMLGRASAALGVQLRLTDSDPGDGTRVPVSGDASDGWLVAERQEGDLALGVDLVLQLAAAAVRQARDDARRAADTPAQSRDEVLTEVLANTAQGRGTAARRARALDIPIDRWHVAVRLEFEELGDADGGVSELAAYENRVALARSVLAGARAGGGVWHTAHSGTAVVLLRMYDEDPGVAVSGEVAHTMDEVLSGVRSRLATSVARCGIGTAHMGAAGLVASATEAKAALTAGRTAGRVNEAVPFDSVGLRRTLVEWYSSEVAQEAVTSVLSPLNELGGAQSERLVRTLQVYLDHGRSLSKTGELMNLHRNAVAYRIHKIFDLLDVDQDNPDDLLLLQLACRARDLS